MTDSSPAVLMVGSMAFDDLQLPSGKFDNVVGGAATYSSIAASLFAPARIVAVVGQDFPEDTLTNLSQRKIDISGIQRAEGKTFRWAGRYADNLGSRTTLDTQLNVFADFSPKLPESYRSSDYVLLGNIHPALQLEVLSQVQAPKFVAADTMNLWIDTERPRLLELLTKLHALVINDEELRQLAEEHNITKAAAIVRAMGPKQLVVKRGEYGAMLFDDEGTYFTPAFPLENEIDPTGAGDTFAGALMGYLASENNVDRATLRKGLMMGSTVASFCVEGVGTARLKELKGEQVAERLAALRDLVRFDD